MKKILITGSQGQLGRALNDYYENHEDVQLINTDVKENRMSLSIVRLIHR